MKATPEAVTEGKASTAFPERRQEGRPDLVRATDLEPDAGLRFAARLLKAVAVLVVLVLLEQAVLGASVDGWDSLPRLIGPGLQLVVAAALLWAAGDLAGLLIGARRDLRVARILLGRIQARTRRLSVQARPDDGPSREAGTASASSRST